MDRKSKIFFVVFFTVALIAVAVSFFKFFVWRDYYIKVETGCNPSQEKCFVSTCDPASDSKCPSDEKARVRYYKLLEKKAYAIMSELSCRTGEDCQEIFCDDTTKTSDQECSKVPTP